MTGGEERLKAVGQTEGSDLLRVRPGNWPFDCSIYKDMPDIIKIVNSCRKLVRFRYKLRTNHSCGYEATFAELFATPSGTNSSMAALESLESLLSMPESGMKTFLGLRLYAYDAHRIALCPSIGSDIRLRYW
jgi:hypothetical protein